MTATTNGRHDVRRTIALLLSGGMLVAMPLVTGHAAHLDVTVGVAQTFTVKVDNLVPAGQFDVASRSTTVPMQSAATSDPGPAVDDLPTSQPATETARGEQAPSTPPSTEADSRPAPTQSTTTDTSPEPTPDPTPSDDEPEPSPSPSGSTDDTTEDTTTDDDLTTADDASDAATPDESVTE